MTINADPRWANTTIPQNGRWYAMRRADATGDDSLTREARTVLVLALSFPQFQVPGVDELLEFHRDTEARAGSGHRPYGKVRIKEAIAELKRKGFYGIRRASLGRVTTSPDRPRMAFARSYGNEPHRHLRDLDLLTDDQIRDHHRACWLAWSRYKATGHFLHQRGNVIDLDERRQARAG